MSDMVPRYDGSTLIGALNRDATALNNTAKATNDTAHNLAAEQTIAGRERKTFQDVYYSYMGGEAAGYIENNVHYYIRGAGAPVDSQVKTHLSLLGDAAFFPVLDKNGDQYYTRVGTFSGNATNVMENHFGKELLYVPAVNGVLPAIVPDKLSVLDCSTFASSAVPTSQITFRCGLNGEVGNSVTRAITIYDSSGTPRTLNYVFTRAADVGTNQVWDLEIQAPSGSTVNGPYSSGNPSNPSVASPVKIQFDANGCPLSFTSGSTASSTPPPLSVTCPGGATIDSAMNLGTVGQPNGVIRISGGQSRLQVQVNGHPSGMFQSLEITANGSIYASFDNGQQDLVGRIAVGLFNNPDGLVMLEEGLYRPDINRSGGVTYAYIGDTPAGNVAVGALEGSTIETIPQMAKMIERQQHFGIITTAYSAKKDMLDKIAKL